MLVDMEEEMKRLLDAPDEPLHPDLQACIDTSLDGLPILKHPLIVTIAPIGGFTNQQYLNKRKQVDAAYFEGDYEQVFWLHERPFRLNLVCDWIMSDVVEGEKAKTLLLEAWMDSEAPSAFWEEARDAFYEVGYLTDSPHREKPIGKTVWRGGPADEDGRCIAEGAMSWSLDRDTASWFAKRFERENFLWKTVVAEEALLGTLYKRGEFEVILDPEIAGGTRVDEDAGVAESAYAADLKSVAARLEGSSPSSSTKGARHG